MCFFASLLYLFPRLRRVITILMVPFYDVCTRYHVMFLYS